MKNQIRLIDYIQNLRKKSQYLFLKEEAGQALGLTNIAILNSIHRLPKKIKVPSGYMNVSTPEGFHGW